MARVNITKVTIGSKVRFNSNLTSMVGVVTKMEIQKYDQRNVLVLSIVEDCSQRLWLTPLSTVTEIVNEKVPESELLAAQKAMAIDTSSPATPPKREQKVLAVSVEVGDLVMFNEKTMGVVTAVKFKKLTKRELKAVLVDAKGNEVQPLEGGKVQLVEVLPSDQSGYYTLPAYDTKVIGKMTTEATTEAIAKVATIKYNIDVAEHSRKVEAKLEKYGR